MKMTLLELVADVLNDMDSDEVNSIDDTTESEQVAQIIKTTYYAMISNRLWPHLRRGIQITSFSDKALPTHMRIQDEIQELNFINYDSAKVDDVRKRYLKIKYLTPDEFLHKTNQENDSLPEVDVVEDPSGIDVIVRNDRAPQWYTSFDDSVVVFDSYDSEIDTTLQESKVQAQAYVVPSWSATDSFIPDLPDNAFIALLEEAKSKAMFKLKQMVDSKAEQEAGRQQRWLARKARRIAGGIKYPDYSRRSRKGRGRLDSEPTFRQDRP